MLPVVTVAPVPTFEALTAVGPAVASPDRHSDQAAVGEGGCSHASLLYALGASSHCLGRLLSRNSPPNRELHS